MNKVRIVMVPPEIIRGLLDLFMSECARMMPHAEIEVILTEEEFRERLARFPEAPFDAAIFGVRILYARRRSLREAGEMIAVALEGIEQGMHVRAGYRCRELLAAVAPEIPTVICDDARGREDEISKLPPTSCYLDTKQGFGQDLFPLLQGFLR